MIFPITYTRMLALVMALDNQGRKDLLSGTELTPEDVMGKIRDVDAETQFTIVRNALRISNDPGLGLQWGNDLHIASHGLLGQLIVSSPTMRHAWKAIERFHGIRGDFASIRGEVVEQNFVMNIQLRMPLDEVGFFFLEALLAIFVRNFELITGLKQQGVRVELGYAAPSYAALYEKYLKLPCRFDAKETAIVTPLALTTMPNPMGDIEVYDNLFRQCEDVSESQVQLKSWSQRVGELLRKNPGHIWTLSDVAGHLHVSPRTLTRHLKEEGNSYQVLLDAELSALAKRYLESLQYTVESVAYMLGYKDVSSFRRAFKRWFSVSPSDYQDQIGTRT